MEKNGTFDIVFAEVAQSSRKRVGTYMNTGGGLGCVQLILATTRPHSIRVADIGKNVDFYIIGAIWEGPPVELSENLLVS